MLLAMRALQGASASVLTTMSMALVSTSFAPGKPRDRALSWYLSGPAFGGALGPLAGAAPTAAGGWRMMFLGQIPLALCVAIASMFLGPPVSPRPTSRLTLTCCFEPRVLKLHGNLSYMVVRTRPTVLSRRSAYSDTTAKR